MDSNRDKKNHYQNVGVSYAPVSTASEDGLVTVRDPHPNSEHPNSGNNSTSAVVDMPHRTQQKPSRWNWKESSGLEKFLIVALICFLLIAVLTVVLVIALPRQSPSQASICMTADCIRTSARIIEAMDRTVDPCDDFFEYACGTWNRVNIIPDDRSTYNTFRKLGDELQVTLKALFEKPVTPSDTLSSRKVKYLFQSCINTSLIEERQDRPLKTLLEWLGGWPVLDPDWESKNTYDLELLLSRLRLLSNRVLMNIWVGADDKNSDVNIILLDQTQLGMPSRDYYLKGRTDRTLQTYQDFAISVAIALGADETRARKEIVEMVDFEITLANITIAEEFRRDTESMYARYKVSELYTNLTKEFDWLKFLNLVFANVSIQLNDSEEVVVYSSRYMVELGKLLQITPKRTLINYVIWSIVLNRVTNLHQKILDLRRPFNKVLHGTDQEQARWRGCTNYVNENLGMAVGRLFVTKHFDNKAKANAMDMIQNIRDAFKELLDDVKWMDDDTKEVAREKANAIQEKIGYPDYIMNDTALDLEHEGLKIDPNTYFENVLSNLNAASRNMFKNLRLPVDKSRWATAPAVVNAFYSATKNQIMFPAGILQPPFYHNNYPKSMNFGGIAMVIGHELTHGFDDRGRQYDKNGNMKQWWSDSVIDRFKEKAQCIIDQYSNYTVKEANMNLNGKQTQGENIADNGGLKQAFRAYKRWVERTNQDEPLLPGLNLTHEQLFFLNFAQIWCGTARPESYVQSIRVGRHSPGRFRVIGVLSNSEEFTEAFKCPPGSKMNPANKCSVW